LNPKSEKQIGRSLSFNRRAALGGGIAYLIWWFVVEASLPGSYNPLPSRLIVVSLFILTFFASYLVPKVAKYMGTYIQISLWALTLHYFYLFHRNQTDINWVVGSYITVMAVVSLIQSRVFLVAYTSFVLALSLALTILDPILLRSIFLPGMITIVLFAFFGLRQRLMSEHHRLLYESSQETLRSRDEFISIASHELKTPITSIKLQTEMAIRGLAKGDPETLNPERVKKMIEQTDRQATRLNKLVDEMLSIYEISAGKLNLDRHDFDMVRLLKKITANAAFEHYPLDMICPDRAMINGDEFRLEQVIENLLSNAKKYGKNLPIQIEMNIAPHELTLVIRDQGIGIDKADQERIFRRYERAVPANKISGLGLGLYISKNIVEAHLGRIEVTSELNHGSQFSVVLPL